MPNVLTRKLKLIPAASLVAAVILFVSCGDDDDDAGNATPTPEPSAEATATPDDNTTPAPSREPVETNAPVELTEFSVRPSVTRADPGTVTFQVTNNGEVPHEFLVIKSDLHIAGLPVDGEDGVIESDVDVVGRIEPMDPGTTGEVAVDVNDGKYVLICNLASDGESHYLNGMYVQFTVAVQPGQQPVVTPVPIQ